MTRKQWEQRIRERRIEILMAGDGDEGMTRSEAQQIVKGETIEEILDADEEHLRETDPTLFAMRTVTVHIDVEVPVYIDDDRVAVLVNRCIDCGTNDAECSADDEDLEDPNRDAAEVLSLEIGKATCRKGN